MGWLLLRQRRLASRISQLEERRPEVVRGTLVVPPEAPAGERPPVGPPSDAPAPPTAPVAEAAPIGGGSPPRQPLRLGLSGLELAKRWLTAEGDDVDILWSEAVRGEPTRLWYRHGRREIR